MPTAPKPAPTPHLVAVTDPVRPTRGDAQKAEQERVRELTARVKKLEGTIQVFLTGTKLTSAQRTELIELLAGTRIGHQASVTAADLKFLERFRALSPDVRRLISGLIGEFEKKGGCG